MEVKVKEELFIFMGHQCVTKFLRVVDRWMQGFAGLWILPVKVASCQRAPIISIDDSVYIKHRYYVELKVVLQVVNQHSLLLIFWVEQGVNQAVYHPGCPSLPRVNPWCEHDDLLLYWLLSLRSSFRRNLSFLFLGSSIRLLLRCLLSLCLGLLLFLSLRLWLVGYHYILNFISRQRVAEGLPLNFLLWKILVKHWISVRQGVCKIYFFFARLKFVCKWHLI